MMMVVVAVMMVRFSLSTILDDANDGGDDGDPNRTRFVPNRHRAVELNSMWKSRLLLLKH